MILFRNETVKSDSKKTGGDYVEIVQMQCPDGWKLFGASCYKFDERSTTWAEADKLCAQEGGRLASIHSKDEDDFIKSNLFYCYETLRQKLKSPYIKISVQIINLHPLHNM